MEWYDAMVVTGKGEVKGKDVLFELMYLASTSTKEADGMIISHKNDLVLWVFSTENFNHVYWAVVPSIAFYKDFRDLLPVRRVVSNQEFSRRDGYLWWWQRGRICLWTFLMWRASQPFWQSSIKSCVKIVVLFWNVFYCCEFSSSSSSLTSLSFSLSSCHHVNVFLFFIHASYSFS